MDSSPISANTSLLSGAVRDQATMAMVKSAANAEQQVVQMLSNAVEQQKTVSTSATLGRNIDVNA